jgi:hypothetical protein
MLNSGKWCTYNMKAALAFCSFLSVATYASLAVAQQASSSDDAFSKKQSLHCADYTVDVQTWCSGPREEGNCPDQTVHFTGSGGTRTIRYHHHRERFSDQSFVASINCSKVDGKFYVLLESTNFGNCNNCEWYEVFSPDGTYIGSTPGMSEDDKITFKPLLRSLEESLERVQEQSSLDISRVK